jgi:hypothetical protein
LILVEFGILHAWGIDYLYNAKPITEDFENPTCMPVNTFDVIKRRKKICFFKIGKIWIFEHFFDDSAIFKELADHYIRFEFKTVGERNEALKLVELRGFEVELVEDLRGLLGQAAQVQQIRSSSAEELRGHDRNPGVVHLPDEGPGSNGGGSEAGSQDCRSGCEILGAWERNHMLPSPAPAPRPPLLPAGSAFQ